MRPLIARAAGIVVPNWTKWAAVAALMVAVYGAGRLHEARRGADAMADYIGKQATQTAGIVKKQIEVQTSVQTKYVDRIQKIYVQGATIETNIPIYIQPADADRFGVNAGFVRVLDAAWSGEPVGPATDSDREPAELSLDAVAAAEVGNATSCRAWRDQALGWRDFYAGQQVAVNGRAGEWADVVPPNLLQQ
ncbi:hypothetical protein HHL21_14615 [Massilia sp. RP-1-19]|uniref:Uncharacterized protein n=1 Tax=Massilia polaris TaxID=2728846 RepID=A0A848HMQ3_9BURK|nr:hypothetical protein [Massilia polaris]NML62287.1 hypothetical protein [Massilia polaris]